jgi:hypothetical protein
MIDIDFLPASYREQTVHRQANVWRVLVGGVFAALIVCSFVFQQFLFRQAQWEFNDIQPQYEQTQALTRRLTEVQTTLKAANIEAELFTYLRHPWPRTRLLSTALAPLPDSVILRQVQIVREHSATPEALGQRSFLKRPNDPDAPKLSPAQHDLNRLRDLSDPSPTVLILSGITTDTAALHHYLVTLGRATLFTKAELTSLQANHSERPGTWRFIARLAVRPGYGQPGGPAEPSGDKPLTQEPLKSQALNHPGEFNSASPVGLPQHQSL